MSNAEQMLLGAQDWEEILAKVPEEKREECLRKLLLEKASKVDEEDLMWLQHKYFEQILAGLPEEERKSLIDETDKDRMSFGCRCSPMAKHYNTIVAMLTMRT